MQIPVKIKKTAGQINRQTPKTSNLNQANPATVAPKRRSRLYLWLLLLVLIEAGIIVFLFLTKPSLPFRDLIPSEAVATIYFKQSALADLLKSLNDNQYGCIPFVLTSKRLEDLLAKNNLQLNEVLSAFDDQLTLVLLPALNRPSPRWLLLAGQQIEEAEFSQRQDKITKNLKQNFNLVSESYRQVSITGIKPLDQNFSGLYFVHLKKLFFLSNDVQIIKEAINRVLK